MNLTRMTVALALPACLLISNDGRAAELQQPVVLFTAGVATHPPDTSPQPPGSVTTCTALGAHGPVDPGRLTLADTTFPDVGPYAVTLPGYGTSTKARSAPQFSYNPAIVSASPGDTLRFDIVNHLTAAEPEGGITNFHAHGIIASPRPCNPLGDYILVEDQPGQTTHYRMDIPVALPGHMFGNDSAPRPYPSGLLWFHAHLHGTTHDSVMAGQSGLLYIGDLHADLRAAPNLDASTASTLDRTDVVYLALRDIQLTVPPAAEPDTVTPGTNATWVKGEDYNTGLCPSVANPPLPPAPGEFSGPGYCGVHGTSTSAPDTVWMYTVNGQYYPTITFRPGAHQIWRIANLSASATYVLQLVDDATGQPQVLNVLALDGLVAGTSAPGATDLHVGVKLKNLLLLPASRAEVFVANVAGTKTRPMTLRTTGITTGPAGDPWPQMSLARVVMEPYAAGPTPQTVLDPTLLETDAAAIPLDVTLPNAARTLSPVIAPVAGIAPVNCVTLPLNTTVRRRVTFSETPTEFELQSEVVTPNGTPIDASHTIGPEQFPMAAATAPNSVPHVCPRLGTREVWELVNTTQELHNFHIHQTKFRLSVQSDPGAPENLVAVQDPSGLIAHYEPEAQGAVPDADVDMWHDTLPVPPASLDGKTPGRTFVTIPFFATQQVGDFVFHCHYLDHEDGGMMAIAQVWDPTVVASTDPIAQLASLMTNAICALPRRAP